MSVYPASNIVIFACNESARMEDTSREVVGCVRVKGWNAEVIAVNAPVWPIDPYIERPGV